MRVECIGFVLRLVSAPGFVSVRSFVRLVFSTAHSGLFGLAWCCVDFDLLKQVKLYSDLLAVTLVLSASSSAPPAALGLRAFRSNVQLVGQHLGWDFEGLLAMGLTDVQVAYGGIMGP